MRLSSRKIKPWSRASIKGSNQDSLSSSGSIGSTIGEARSTRDDIDASGWRHDYGGERIGGASKGGAR
ncbi:hypothetical protein U1Q18_016152 [Sarracenia purpurea var. burkii]